MCTKKLIKVFGLIIVVALLAAALPLQAKAQEEVNSTITVCASGCNYTTIQAAIDAASAGDTILVSGTFVHTGTATLNKDITLTCATGAKIQVSGTGESFKLQAGASIEGCEIEKTDKTDQHNIITLEASGVAVKNNLIHGQWAIGDNEVSRAMVVYAGNNTGLEISGNEIWGLRQPAYISGTNTGTVSNNYVHGTKGWVIEGGNLTFSGNTFAGNVGDIAILPQVPAQYYTDILALSAANNNAVVEDQRVSPAVLSVVYVDDSAAAGGNGTEASPYQSIQAGINRVIAGGTVNVAAGTYNQAGGININVPGLTIVLKDGVVIQNTSPCFIVDADNVTITSATPGGLPKCVPTGSSDGIVVNAGVQGLRVVGLEIDGTGQTTGDGIHFNGAASGVYLVSNSIHDLDGDAIEFVAAPTGSVTIEFNRFYNNGGNGLTIPSGAQISAINNWWGCNAGPGNSGCDTASENVDYDPWLILKITSEKQIVEPGEEIQIDANLIYNSAGENTLSDGYVPDGIEAEFSVQSPGVVNPDSTKTIQGQVSTTFTSTGGGVYNVCVTVDNQTVCTENIVVPAAAAVDDVYRMMFNSTLDVAFAEGVTKNDTGITDFAYVVSLVSGPTHGQLELKPDGSFKYIPEANFLGEDAFVYQLVIYPREPAPLNNQNPWTDQATVTISVEAYQIFMPLILK